jgi:FkbM family methyltransferase
MRKRINFRIHALRYWLSGYLSFSEFLYLALPYSMRPQQPPKRKFENNVEKELLGKPFIIPNGEMMGFVTLVDQIVNSNQYRVELIKPNATVFDGGANMGVFSVFAAATHPDATIYSFEPTPSTFAALQQNASHYPNIKVFNCALGDAEKMVSIIVEPKDSGSNHLGEGGIPIPMKTIDGFNQKVDFLKMDTEGYEGPIIRGAAQTIKRSKPTIVMSAYHHPEDKTELPALLNSITPYDCELHHDAEEDLVCIAK